MEQILRTNAALRPRFSQSLRRWIDRYRTQWRMSREMKQLAELPDHLLRDIGREDLIAPPKHPGPLGH